MLHCIKLNVRDQENGSHGPVLGMKEEKGLVKIKMDCSYRARFYCVGQLRTQELVLRAVIFLARSKPKSCTIRASKAAESVNAVAT